MLLPPIALRFELVCLDPTHEAALLYCVLSLLALVTQGREGIDYYPEDDVEHDNDDHDKEGQVEEVPSPELVSVAQERLC